MQKLQPQPVTRNYNECGKENHNHNIASSGKVRKGVAFLGEGQGEISHPLFVTYFDCDCDNGGRGVAIRLDRLVDIRITPQLPFPLQKQQQTEGKTFNFLSFAVVGAQNDVIFRKQLCLNTLRPSLCIHSTAKKRQERLLILKSEFIRQETSSPLICNFVPFRGNYSLRQALDA